jgi:hypothetical protein
LHVLDFRMMSRSVVVQWHRWLCLPIAVLLAIVMLSSTAAAQEGATGAQEGASPDPKEGAFPGSQEGGSPAADEGAESAQAPATDGSYVPIRMNERLDWTIDDTIGPLSLAAGAFKAAYETALNTPKHWGRSPSGFWKRAENREIDVALSSSIEAGLGAIWGEEPRYIPSHQSGIWPRVGYATKTVFVAQRPDGHLAPAWGRYAGNVFNNVIENTWLPSTVTTWQRTLVRSSGGFLSRWAGNVWREFWPDLHHTLMRSHPAGTGGQPSPRQHGAEQGRDQRRHPAIDVAPPQLEPAPAVHPKQ